MLTSLPLSRLGLPLLAVAAFVLFSLNIGGYDLWPADEPRYAQVAREMLQSGDFLVPRVNGEIYLEKPPLLFWSQALVSAPFGDVSETTARIPSVVAGVCVVVLTYLLARRLFGAGTAFWSAVLLMTCQRIWWQARTGQIDMLLTAFMMLALYSLWRWHEERRTGWLVVVYACMGAGMLAKGPPAIVFILLFIFAFYWGDPLSRKQTHWVLGTLAATALTLAWYIPARLAAGGGDTTEAVQSGIAENLFRNTVGRLVLGVSKAEWPWYYVETIPADLLPWTLLLPWAIWWFWRNRNESAMHRLLWCWTVPALIFFSLSVGKRAIYILPLFPVFAIILACSLEAFRHSTEKRRMIVWAMWTLLLVVLGIGAMAAPRFVPLERDTLPVILGGLVLAVGVAYFFLARRNEARHAPQWMAAAMAVVFVAAPFTAFPVVNEFKGAADFCAPVRQAAERGDDFQLYSVAFSREEFIYYTHKFHKPVLMDLVGRERIPPEELMETAKFQKAAKEVLGEAVEEVPVADWNAITNAEVTALHDAARAALDAEEDLDHARLPEFEAALAAEIDAFWQEFVGGGDAFLMVQEEDWKWMMALQPEIRDAISVHAMNVGQRRVLLLRNTP